MSTNTTHITASDGTPFIEVVREFDAPVGLVFRASTDPDLVAQWLDRLAELLGSGAVRQGS
jgi:uncharacterized protein YndB with AHSA1/START domain